MEQIITIKLRPPMASCRTRVEIYSPASNLENSSNGRCAWFSICTIPVLNTIPVSLPSLKYSNFMFIAINKNQIRSRTGI